MELDLQPSEFNDFEVGEPEIFSEIIKNIRKMKTKLLKKCRKQVKLYERNGSYYVDTGNYMDLEGKVKEEALRYYRIWIIRTARGLFGFRPKKTFFS